MTPTAIAAATSNADSAKNKLRRLDIGENDDSLWRGMRGLAAIAVVAAALAVAGSAPAGQPLPAQKTADAALRRAVATGQVDRATAARYRAEINRAARLIRVLPSGRRERVGVALAEVAAFVGRLTTSRAVALFGQLRANDDYFSRHWAPRDHTDITDANGVVYRYFAGRCLEFHPLAEFAALNARVNAKDVAGTQRLADALIARGVSRGDGLGWEYYFAFGGGRPPWLSGMAQAVAAQAFARAATLLPEDEATLLRAARGAYRMIPGRLITRLAAGPWIRLYAFDSTAVLNAQLQAIVSLRTYATKSGDASAASLVTSLEQTAAAMLPRFDTGYWTYYALPNDLSTVHYHDYVIRLLTFLASDDRRFADAAARFTAYRHQPPAFKLVNGAVGELRFWLSKPSRVHAYSAAGPTKTLRLGAGWHTLAWNEPALRGIYPIKVDAVDWAGNRASFEGLPIVRVSGRRRQETARATAAARVERHRLVIGAGVEDAAEGARAQRLGLRLARFVVPWPAGAETPDPALVAELQRLPPRLGLLVELTADPVPADDARRAALAEYAAVLGQQLPNLRTLVLAPAPVALTASSYAQTLTAIRGAVHGVLPEVELGPLIDGATAPKATIGALTAALASDVADIVAFRPAATAAVGEWTAANVPQLVTALAQAFGTAPPLLIDGLATPTTIPAGELAFYPEGQQPTDGAVSPAEQGKAYASAINAAACSTAIAGVILDRFADSPIEPAPPTGIYFASSVPKASASVVAAAAPPAQRGIVVCPGLASQAAASTLTFPDELDSSSQPAVALACARDCLYLVTLNDARGRPVAARRGSLRGGGRALTLELPKTKLGGAHYRFDVRLVDRVNPGPVTRLTSGLLPVSPS